MERLAAPAPLHDGPPAPSSSTSNWSATLPHRQWLSQHQHHYQYQVQQHNRSRSNSGRDALLSVTDSRWRSPPVLSAPPNDAPLPAYHSSTPDQRVLHPASYNSPHLPASYPHSPVPPPYVPPPAVLGNSLSASFPSSSAGNLNTSFGALSTSSSLGTTTPVGPLSAPERQSAHPPAMELKKEVMLNSMEWFHGKIKRDEAEELLQPRDDGLFLVRESTNFPGDYTLCVCFQNKVEHYRVIHKNGQLTIDEEEFFDELTKLVAHYKEDADGLCTQLVRALPKASSDAAQEAYSKFNKAGWVIPREKLTVGDSIGKGEFGDVLLGTLDDKKVAVKRLKDNSSAAKQLLDEASLMTNLNHKNLVALLGLVFEESSILLVTDYMSKGSLVDYLRSRGRLHVTKLHQIKFACDTAAGMAYLESRNVVHRDLAARNVLISGDDVAKVSDFGLAKSSESKMDNIKFPIKWTAPEALKYNKFSNKSDMWSFGILLWEIYSFGRVPYPKIPLAEVTKYVEGGHRMDPPDNCPEEVYQIMSEAWQQHPGHRPTFKDVLHKLLSIKTNTPA